MAKRKTILGIPKCGQPTSCAPYAPLGCSVRLPISDWIELSRFVRGDLACMEEGTEVKAQMRRICDTIDKRVDSIQNPRVCGPDTLWRVRSTLLLGVPMI